MLLLAEGPPPFDWPAAAVGIAGFACLAFVAWCMKNDDSDGITIWFAPPRERFVPSWKGKDQGRKAGDPIPPAPPQNGASS